MTSHTLYVNWSNGRCPLKSIPLYPSPSLQIYPSLAFDRYSSPNICPSISLPQDISVDIEAHNLSQEQSVPSTHWLPFPPTRSAARSTPQQWLSARDSWRAESDKNCAAWCIQPYQFNVMLLGPNDLSNRVGRYRLNNDSNNHVITGNQLTMPEPTGNECSQAYSG